MPWLGPYTYDGSKVNPFGLFGVATALPLVSKVTSLSNGSFARAIINGFPLLGVQSNKFLTPP